MVDSGQFAGDGGFRAMELTKVAQNNGMDPISWAVQVSWSVSSGPITLPSHDLATLLVSHICWGNNVPTAWKFLEKGLAMGVVPPPFVIALLSSRVIPCRHFQPAAYRLYMEILKKYLFAMNYWKSGPTYHKILKSIDLVMNLSSTYASTEGEPGVIIVGFYFSIVQQLLTASLEDEGLLEVVQEKNPARATKPQEMELDAYDNYEEMKVDGLSILKKMNTATAIDIVSLFLKNKATSRILYLVSRNMPEHWLEFKQRLLLLKVNYSVLQCSHVLSPEGLFESVSDSGITWAPCLQRFSIWKTCVASPMGSSSSSCPFEGVPPFTSWLPIDIVLEDAMDGSLVTPTSAIETITGLVRSLQAINRTTWHDTFLALWIAALRLVQRDRDPIEGPFPRLDTRLCMLLSVTVLVVAELVGGEEGVLENGCNRMPPCGDGGGHRLLDLASSLQILGDYQGLLAPPQPVLSPATQAAAKAMMFISGIKVGTDYFECIAGMDDFPLTCSGNLRHLIVEACIARKLLDTSAYFWAGYVNGQINPIHHGTGTQVPSWSTFMKGAPLSSLLVKALVSTPASSIAEVERIFQIALRGSEDEKIQAAVILCGASLVRGWNIQEHTTHFITRLLSPPPPAEYDGSESHLINFAPMLNVLIVGIASVDCIHVFSLHGLVPHLASALMPICEVFGSCAATQSWIGAAGEEISAHVVFSNAFTLLLKLWRFNYPPIDHGLGTVPPIGSQLTPEYLLLIRNSHLKDPRQHQRRLSAITAGASSSRPVFLDSFPKLKVWYRQHQACIASTLPGQAHGTVRRTVDALLGRVFNRVGRSGHGISSGNSTSTGSAAQGNEDTCSGPDLPAWDILEAIPFVVDSALTACAHGQLCPRELATGLKGLADLLPASLASIASYFSAEVTRGVWRPAFMNGTDWPSPAANLSNVEDQIKKILAPTGVDIPSLVSGGNSPATLPLPLAAFVSLTITYKIDRASEHFLTLVGPALESLAAGCPWPCMPIVASLWTQKAKRWSDFLIFSASRTVFLHSSHAVVQLLRSCFSVTLAPSSSPHGGVGPLLGHGLGRRGTSPAAPGFLYLRVYRSIRDGVLVAEEVLSILLHSVRDIASRTIPGGNPSRYGRVSLAVAVDRVRLAASLGASLVWLSGGAGVVQSLVKETLPTWFICSERTGLGRLPGEAASTLGGDALAHFVVMCVAFTWGVGPATASSRHRAEILRVHTRFMAAAMDGGVMLGCSRAAWRAYVTGFLGLVTVSVPVWVTDMDTDVLTRIEKGLRRWGEDELAFLLLAAGGFRAMATAAEIIVEGDL